MKKSLNLLFYIFSILVFSQDDITADWNINVDGNDVTLSIVEFNNFTVGLDGHWHYILDDNEYVAVHDINDILITNLSIGTHTIYVWLVNHMHEALDPPVEETITFNIESELSINENEIFEVIIHPNPINDNFINITSNLDGPKNIELFSLDGKKVINTSIDGNILNLSLLNNGIYIMKVEINEQTKVFKLVVN